MRGWMGEWVWHESNLPSRAGQALFGRDTCIGQTHRKVGRWMCGWMGGLVDAWVGVWMGGCADG